MSKDSKIFVNLPVKNLENTRKFFSALGFKFNEQFCDQNAICMVINESIYVMLLVEEFFKTFTKKELADAKKSTEVILAISAESRKAVDELVDKALAAGAKPSNEPMDHGFMYGRSFQDLDEHLWEVMFMDPAALGQPQDSKLATV